ncbi:porin [Bacteroidota bacterium]
MRKLILLVAIFCASFTNAQKDNSIVSTEKFGKGILNLKGKDNSWSLKFAARMQMLSTFNLDNQNGLGNLSSSALVRRSRLKFDGFAYTPKLKYKLELGLSNPDLSGGDATTKNANRMILDAVVMWNFTGNFVLWYGQTKLPGNIERVISSGNLQFVDRSRLNKEFTIDREFGFQLRHHFNLTDKFVVREKIAVSQGEARNITVNNKGGHQYTSRLELLPFGLFESKGDYKGGDLKREQSPKLMLSVGQSYIEDAVRQRGNQGSYFIDLEDPATIDADATDVSTFFADAMFKYKGFSFMGEYAARNAKNEANVRVGNGLNLSAGYLMKSNWEVAGRFTNISLENGGEERNEYTVGLSRYIAGHKLKVQSDVSYIDIIGKTNTVGIRFQVDIHL